MIADLPQTPREAFESLHGSRPDLALTPARGKLFAAIWPGGNGLAESPMILSVWHVTGSQPLVIALGGLN